MTVGDSFVFSAMQTGIPFKSYRKTILGKVYVTVLNPFSNQPEGLLLEGDAADQKSVIDVWTEKDDIFFRRMNKVHFDEGAIIEFKKDTNAVPERTIEAFTDEELKGVINQKYLALLATLNKTDKEAVLYRMLTIAQSMEKSEKIIKIIESRLAEVQEMNLPQPNNEVILEK